MRRSTNVTTANKTCRSLVAEDALFDPQNQAVGSVAFLDGSAKFFDRIGDALLGGELEAASALHAMDPASLEQDDETIGPTGGMSWCFDETGGVVVAAMGENSVLASGNRGVEGSTVMFGHDEAAFADGQNQEIFASATMLSGELSQRRDDVAIRGFVAGTVVQTDKGEMLVEHLDVSQRILTRDRGFQHIVWMGCQQFSANELCARGDLRAVVIEAGALGPNMPTRQMTVAPQHRLLVEGPRTKLMFGEREVFIPAEHFVGFPGVARGPQGGVSYVHVMCAAHEVVWADGIWTESFQLNDLSLAGLEASHRIEIASLNIDYRGKGFPEARRTLSRREADILLV
ncbi:MAG: Hint domain-containing protein [Paracoccaceae bacterium]